jgi:hypothetical protein
MSHLSDKQRRENNLRFIKQCDGAISYWAEKQNSENIEYFKNLKLKHDNQTT